MPTLTSYPILNLVYKLLQVHLMIESTAAAMGYGLLVAGTKNAMIVDMGGGTTDLTLLHIADGVHDVEATGGHTGLGGCNMDIRLYELVVKEIVKGIFCFV